MLGSTIYQGDNLKVMKHFTDGFANLIYVDPPFNTGKVQKRTTKHSYDDSFDDYMGFIRPRMEKAYDLLTDDGSLFFHIDYREVHYCKVMLDKIFGRECFMNEIIWAYDYGARSKRKWSAKHDNILWYVKDPKKYTFNYDEMDRIPYMAPGLVGKEKAARGKTPTDVWWHTIVSPTGKEKTGYPTQKPEGVLKRIIEIHSNPGDVVLDFFAGSGTSGYVAATLHRRFVMIDNNPDAVEIMRERLAPVTKALLVSGRMYR